MSKRIAHRDVFAFLRGDRDDLVFYFFFGSVVSPSLMLIVIIDDDDDVFIVEYGLSFSLWCLTKFEKLAR